uniref:Uncharacterized protein n=1 Tax=Kalanchoe fedtschenkoi TaxID=63787 RepID=A0A7N0T7Z7_KALFE
MCLSPPPQLDFNHACDLTEGSHCTAPIMSFIPLAKLFILCMTSGIPPITDPSLRVLQEAKRKTLSDNVLVDLRHSLVHPVYSHLCKSNLFSSHP